VVSGARATVVRRPPLRVITRVRWWRVVPGRAPRPVRSAAASSSTRSALCSSSRISAADRRACGPGSVSAAATRARAWSRVRPTVVVWSGSTAGRRTPVTGFPPAPSRRRSWPAAKR